MRLYRNPDRPGRLAFDPAFYDRIAEGAGRRKVIDHVVPIRSGWAWGQRYLSGVTEVLQAPVGKGMLVLFGPDPYFRSQPHGTFKLLFNGLLYRNDLGD